MAPRHKNPSRKERTAVAPYNFIPPADPLITFADDERNPLAVDQSRYQDGRWTGWIDVTLTTRSPLYVRGSLTPPDHEKMERQEKSGEQDNTPHLDKVRNRPDFFHTGNPSEPVIPGSSLRGMIRNLTEILGHGKLKPVMNTPLVYRAVGDTSSHGEAYRKLLMAEEPDRKHYYTPLFQAGYIRFKKETGRWYIQPAQKTADGASYGRINHRRIPQGRLQPWYNSRNVQKIYVRFGPLDFQKVKEGFLHIKYAKVPEAASNSAGSSLTEAVLVRSGPMFSKKTEAVFLLPDDEKDWIPIPDGSDPEDKRDLVTAYRDQITLEQEKLLGRDGVLVDYQPVFYLIQDGKLFFFFGHTQMFRVPYPRSPQDFLPPSHWDDGRMDFAEAMFGTARGKAETGLAGRIFITDAHLSNKESKDVWLPGNPVVIPKVLSSPKPTTFQHYLAQPNPDVPQGKGLHTYNSSPSQTTLRGHKLYWHKGHEVSRTDFAENERDIERQKDKIHTQIKPVREGVQFTFKVYFENLLPAELGLLWWTIALPVADGREYCHKLGMGKPLGLGAVKLEPTLNLVDSKTRYNILFDAQENPTQWANGVGKLTQQALDEAVSNFETFILRRSKRPEGKLADTERVQMLLAMLAWPGPNPANTRYMEIEREDPQAKRGKTNEYKERPVLPDPLHVK